MPSPGRIGVQTEIGILHRPVDAPREAHTEEIRQAEVAAALTLIVVERRGKRRENAAAACDVRANRIALRIGQRGRVRKDQQLEASRRSAARLASCTSSNGTRASMSAWYIPST